MNILACIPARMGSVGIPNKNVRPFCGQALLHWTIKAAVNSSLISKVTVSTDSNQYAEAARQAGAEVPFLRPAELSGACASSESALLHALHWLRDNEGYEPEWLLFLQCTNPFTRAEDIDGLINKVLMEDADCGFTAVRSHRFLWKVSENGDATGINHDMSKRLRRQDMMPEYAENGGAYLMKAAGFMEHQHRFFEKTVLYEVPAYQGFEIDDEDDWAVAESIFRHFYGKTDKKKLPETISLIVFDFDGVITDNSVFVDEKGIESVKCDRGDGMGIRQLKEHGYRMMILSKERNPVVSQRAEKMGIPAVQSTDHKRSFLTDYCKKEGVQLSEVIYMGNDINDLEAMEIVGFSVAPADAYPDVKAKADLVLSRNGGNGAVRELSDLILNKNA